MSVDQHTNLPPPRSRVCLQKLTVSQSRNTPHFTEPEGSLPHPWAPATCPCPEPVHAPIPLLRIILIFSHVCLGLPGGLFPTCFPTKTLYVPLLCPIRATRPCPSYSFDLITLITCGEEYRVFHYAVAFISLSPSSRVPRGGLRCSTPPPRNSQVLSRSNRIANWAENV
jgi:hypothetical protein